MSAFPPNPEEEFRKFQFIFASFGGVVWTIFLLIKLFVK